MRTQVPSTWAIPSTVATVMGVPCGLSQLPMLLHATLPTHTPLQAVHAHLFCHVCQACVACSVCFGLPRHFYHLLSFPRVCSPSWEQGCGHESYPSHYYARLPRRGQLSALRAWAVHLIPGSSCCCFCAHEEEAGWRIASVACCQALCAPLSPAKTPLLCRGSVYLRNQMQRSLEETVAAWRC